MKLVMEFMPAASSSGSSSLSIEGIPPKESRENGGGEIASEEVSDRVRKRDGNSGRGQTSQCGSSLNLSIVPVEQCYRPVCVVLMKSCATDEYSNCLIL